MVNPARSSPGLSGGISVSTMLPCTFETMIELDVLAKAFWITVIIRMPGARNTAKGTPSISPRCVPIASVKTSMNSTAVATGAASVCVQTLVKRRISRSVSVARPSQLTRPKRRTPISGFEASAGVGKS